MVVPRDLLSQSPSLAEAEWVAPPCAAVCLTTPYAAKPGQKGGTLLKEGVRDLAEHRRLLSDPDGYRPDRCPRCGGFVHAHDFRSRKLRDQSDSAQTEIRRYLCPCSAVWQVLPGFLARHLHRTWGAVQSALVAAGALESTGAEWRVKRKPSTLRRWLGRLDCSALVLTQAFAAADLASLFERIGAWCTRGELVQELARAGTIEKPRQLEQLACWSHRLTPGLRLM